MDNDSSEKEGKKDPPFEAATGLVMRKSLFSMCSPFLLFLQE